MMIGPVPLPSSDFPETAASAKGQADIVSESIPQECKDIEERALTSPIRPYKYCKGRQVNQLEFFKDAVVSDRE